MVELPANIWSFPAISKLCTKVNCTNWNMEHVWSEYCATADTSSRVCLADSLMSNTTGKSMLFSSHRIVGIAARNKNCVQMQRAFQFSFSSDLEQIFSLKHEVPCPNLLCGSSFGCYFRTSIEKIILSSQSHRNKSKQQAARRTCTDDTIRCQRSETGKWKIWKRTWVKVWKPDHLEDFSCIRKWFDLRTTWYGFAHQWGILNLISVHHHFPLKLPYLGVHRLSGQTHAPSK